MTGGTVTQKNDKNLLFPELPGNTLIPTQKTNELTNNCNKAVIKVPLSKKCECTRINRVRPVIPEILIQIFF
jgi:hypothetical protein